MEAFGEEPHNGSASVRNGMWFGEGVVRLLWGGLVARPGGEATDQNTEKNPRGSKNQTKILQKRTKIIQKGSKMGAEGHQNGSKRDQNGVRGPSGDPPRAGPAKVVEKKVAQGGIS